MESKKFMKMDKQKNPISGKNNLYEEFGKKVIPKTVSLKKK